jgi:hypothetical protein
VRTRREATATATTNFRFEIAEIAETAESNRRLKKPKVRNKNSNSAIRRFAQIEEAQKPPIKKGKIPQGILRQMGSVRRLL